MKRIVLVLRSGGDFTFNDVKLIVHHINEKWKSVERPEIVCFWDKADEEIQIDNLRLLPLKNDFPRWWSRMTLYSPSVEHLRPFLYVDLDTAIIQSLENIFDLVKDPSMFITLEDFYRKGMLATGLTWFPANSKKLATVWKRWEQDHKHMLLKSRMDYFLKEVVKSDLFWQQITTSVKDFKPRVREITMRPYLEVLPEDTNVVCFHGQPRIPGATNIAPWINEYVNFEA